MGDASCNIRCDTDGSGACEPWHKIAHPRRCNRLWLRECEHFGERRRYRRIHALHWRGRLHTHGAPQAHTAAQRRASRAASPTPPPPPVALCDPPPSPPTRSAHQSS
uniref:Uncharacterized protein n=1 Tax=Prymnesium polylepis TaxID=72548 RepID=A0A6V4HT13_9EUKA|mmetsp:Transcript_71786/g.196640  ORF Transcript_71786/g.196640 Transcript_71786/m.196640 type:complete len:107 (-) Transcript_71786:389-709(-)